jgi:predicted nucleotidyltransferase
MNSFGLEPKHWTIVKTIAIAPLEAQSCEVWVFGSRARNDHKTFSDLDLLVVGNPNPRLISQIREDLEESLLPIRVDLVLDSELAESYRASVFKDRVRA